MPRMADGNLDGGFFAIYTAQGPLTPAGYAAARKFALGRSDLIDSTITRFTDRIVPARTAADVERIAAQGKLVALKSMENSYPLGEYLTLLAAFHSSGGRLAGQGHSHNNNDSSSPTDHPACKRTS